MSRTIYLFPKERMGVTYPYVYWDNLFSDEELNQVIEYCGGLELQEGYTVGKDGTSDFANEKRKSKIAFFNPDDTNRWIFERMCWVTEQLNNRFYEFDLNGFAYMQYTTYNGDGEEKYDYHMDTILGTDKPIDTPETRKLSLILVLSDPSEYEGGEFQLQTGDPSPERMMTVEQLKGRVIAFPSFMIHRVAPVTSGLRKSVVTWVDGPKFK